MHRRSFFGGLLGIIGCTSTVKATPPQQFSNQLDIPEGCTIDPTDWVMLRVKYKDLKVYVDGIEQPVVAITKCICGKNGGITRTKTKTRKGGFIICTEKFADRVYGVEEIVCGHTVICGTLKTDKTKQEVCTWPLLKNLPAGF